MKNNSSRIKRTIQLNRIWKKRISRKDVCPDTMRVYKYIRSEVWEREQQLWVEPMFGSMHRLREIQVRMSPRFTEKDFPKFSQELFENSGEVLFVTSNAEAFAKGVVIIAVNAYAENYSQDTVIDALRQMKKELRSSTMSV